MARRTLCVCALVLVLGGCAPGNPGLLIGAALQPSETCTYDSSGTQLLLGSFDVAPATARYFIVPLYFNQLLNLSQTGAPPRADPNIIAVTQAQVELRDVAGGTLALDGLPNPFTVPATGLVPSSDGTTAGNGVGAIEVIPPIYGDALRATAIDTEIVAVVRAIGTTMGGAEVVSPEFHWPIHVCFGCLFACVLDEETGAGLCSPTCTPGQDSVTITPGACGEPPVFGGCLGGG